MVVRGVALALLIAATVARPFFLLGLYRFASTWILGAQIAKFLAQQFDFFPPGLLAMASVKRGVFQTGQPARQAVLTRKLRLGADRFGLNLLAWLQLCGGCLPGRQRAAGRQQNAGEGKGKDEAGGQGIHLGLFVSGARGSGCNRLATP